MRVFAAEYRNSFHSLDGLYARIGRETAIDGEGDAGNETGGVVVEKEEKSSFKVLCHSESSHRSRRENLSGARSRSPVGVPQERSVLLRREEAGSYRVDAYALF